MENKEIDILDLFKVILGERRLIIKWGIIGAAIGLVIAFSIPKQYQTKVLVVTESKQKSSMNPLGALSDNLGLDIGSSGQSSDGISEKVYPTIVGSSPFLLELVDIPVTVGDEQVSFYDYITQKQRSPWWSSLFKLPSKVIGATLSLFSDENIEADSISIFNPTKKQLSYIENLKNNILVFIDKKNGSIEITTTMQDPYVAAIVSDSILLKLQRYMVEYRTAKNRHDLDMNNLRLAEARNNYYYADSVYAAASDRNQRLISQTARIKLERLRDEKELTFGIYQQLASQVEISKVKLQESTPIATVIEPASVSTLATSPKKLTLLITFTFLAVFVAMGFVAAKQIFGKN